MHEEHEPSDAPVAPEFEPLPALEPTSLAPPESLLPEAWRALATLLAEARTEEPGEAQEALVAEPEAAPEAPMARSLEVHRPLVALVMHDAEIGRALAEQCGLNGWRTVLEHVAECEDDEEGVADCVSREAPSVIVYDIVQPFDDELARLRRLKRRLSRPERTFVVTTTSKTALSKRGSLKAVELREPEHLHDVTDAVRAALESEEA